MNLPVGLAYTASVGTAVWITRLWYRFRKDRAARRSYALPLFDAALLEAACHPRAADSDDADVLAEMRDTLGHLNRQAYAEEFWTLDKQLRDYYTKIPKTSRPTMRRALIRLLTANDRWLQLVAAKTCADIGLPEAIAPLRALVEMGESMGFSESKLEYSSSQQASIRFRQEMEASLERLGRMVP